MADILFIIQPPFNDDEDISFDQVLQTDEHYLMWDPLK